jgi:hypothetical protein
MNYIYDSGTDYELRRQLMTEGFDEYIDQFTMGAGAYGVAINFRKTNPKPVAPGSVPPTEEIGTIRMSLEHLKVMAFVLKRQVDEVESQLGIEIPLPMKVMHGLQIAPEDWTEFWKRSK